MSSATATVLRISIVSLRSAGGGGVVSVMEVPDQFPPGHTANGTGRTKNLGED
jgi:hypothetical protein